MLPEREPFFMLGTVSQDAVVGFNHTNLPRSFFKKSFWQELIQWQIDNDGSRKLMLDAGQPDNKRCEVVVFKDLRKQIQGLTDQERNACLSKIIGQIQQARNVILLETDPEKYTTNYTHLEEHCPYPHSQIQGLSNNRLQSLIGDLPSLDDIRENND